MRKEGEFCALIASKSFASYAAILGIMRAGKGYLPVASDDPVDRIVAALAQIHCSSLLSDNSGMAFAGMIASKCPEVTPVSLPEIMTSAEAAAGHNLPRSSEKWPVQLIVHFRFYRRAERRDYEPYGLCRLSGFRAGNFCVRALMTASHSSLR
ncbi:amino acid adenylation domain [Serratia marcescens]|uniref:Amino acid adenylation domain n=1 Tax=Serratia marcescens TaxID=615 RepID=A0A380AIB7_SERMA|nr:amino acid adenylation domain [Serratia marcescens]